MASEVNTKTQSVHWLRNYWYLNWDWFSDLAFGAESGDFHGRNVGEVFWMFEWPGPGQDTPGTSQARPPARWRIGGKVVGLPPCVGRLSCHHGHGRLRVRGLVTHSGLVISNFCTLLKPEEVKGGAGFPTCGTTKRSVFSTNTQSRFVLIVLDGVLRPPRRVLAVSVLSL